MKRKRKSFDMGPWEGINFEKDVAFQLPTQM